MGRACPDICSACDDVHLFVLDSRCRCRRRHRISHHHRQTYDSLLFCLLHFVCWLFCAIADAAADTCSSVLPLSVASRGISLLSPHGT